MRTTVVVLLFCCFVVVVDGIVLMGFVVVIITMVVLWHCSRGMFLAVGEDLRNGRLFVRELYNCAV